MKKLIVLFLVNFVLYSQAQITLTAETSVPQVGQSVHIFGQMQPTIHVNHSGPNQIWDFSGINPTPATFSFILPSNTDYSSYFSNATLSECDGSNYNYYSSDANGYYLEGQVYPSSGSITFTDKREMLKFPITYNDIFYETFAGTVNGFDRSGNIKIHADGYGSLILPYITVPNVLKVTITCNYSDFYDGTEYYTYVDTIQMWYHLNNKTQIASRTLGYYNGILYADQATYINQSDLGYFITPGIETISDSDIHVYSNSGTIYIQTANDIESLELYSDIGNKIVTGTSSNSKSIPNVSSGFYIVKIKMNSKETVKKIIVN